MLKKQKIMNNFKIIINRLMIYSFLAIGLALYILDVLDVIKGGRYLALIVCCLIVYNFVEFFYKGVVRISFCNKDYIVLDKYTFFKNKRLKLDILELKYRYKRRISYPNEFHELFFVIGQNEILINSSGGVFFSFTESDEKEIIKKLDELNIKKID